MNPTARAIPTPDTRHPNPLPKFPALAAASCGYALTMKLTFHGAAREVTGSLHLIETAGKHIALDCGMFQGRRVETAARNRQFPFNPATLDAVILSHAHIDHTGRLPLLVKQGFAGTIYATPATRDLCAIMLADSAHIQEEDAKYMSKKKAETGQAPVEPLYDARDAADTLRLFSTVPLNRPHAVSPHLTLEYAEAGHMLGSASLRLTDTSGPKPVRLTFSGDLGRFGSPILRDPQPPAACDYLICESTYGGRATESNKDLDDRLETVIGETFSRGGKVIIPAFSVGRTQTIVYCLHQLMQAGRLKDVEAFIDSPLAVSATEVYQMHPDLYDVEARRFNRETGDMLGAACCRYVRDVEDSKRIDQRRRPCVVISASGMCENGRILHHLKHAVPHSRNAILIVGYQGQGTLGRRIVEKEKQVRIFGVTYPLRARVEVINGFSAHADRNELQRLLKPLAPECKSAFLVHGEPEQMESMETWLRGDGFRDVRMPASGDSVELN